MLALILPLALHAGPETPEPDTWTLDADKDTLKPVVLKKDLSRDEVIALLGKRLTRKLDKKQPSLEILRFTRVIPGPLTRSTATGAQGITTITHHTFFNDRIEVTLRDSLLTTVTVKREKFRDHPNMNAPFGPPS